MERNYATQMDAARRRMITPELKTVAAKEHMSVEELLPLVACGKVVIPANKNHKCLNPEGIGSMLRTKINVNLGGRTAYDALTDAQTALVNNLSVLTEAEEKLEQLKKEKADQDAADAVIAKIQAVETAVASGDKAAIRKAIRAARTAYNRLTSAQKKLVTNYSVLTEAEKAYPGTSNSTKPGSSTSAGSTVKSSDTGDSSQMTLWMSGVLLSAAALIVLTRKRKRGAE